VAVGDEAAYGHGTESSSSVVIQDSAVPGERQPEAAPGTPASKSRDLMNSDSAYADTHLRVETAVDSETAWIVIRGEADFANVDQLGATLTGLQLDGTKSVRIDASELAFFDVATMRCLTTFARTMKETGRDVAVCGATPMLQDVAHVLGLRDELGLV
jgi:anti-anti-sigma factor